MPISQHAYRHADPGKARDRRAWMPHPGLMAFILALWLLAIAAQAPVWLKH